MYQVPVPIGTVGINLYETGTVPVPEAKIK